MHVSQRLRRKLKRGTVGFKPVVFPTIVFVLLLFLNIWRRTDTKSDFYLHLKARRQNKVKGKTHGTCKRNDPVWNMMEPFNNSLRIREHSINFNLSKWFHLRLWDSQLLLSTAGSLMRLRPQSQVPRCSRTGPSADDLWANLWPYQIVHFWFDIASCGYAISTQLLLFFNTLIS